jgi:ATP-dependent HslUV protease subunit HslV
MRLTCFTEQNKRSSRAPLQGGGPVQLILQAMRALGALRRGRELCDVGARTLAAGTEHHGTTVVSVRRQGEVALAADGQVTLGSQVIKPTTTKVRKLEGGSLAGFAGATADAMTLSDMLEKRLEEKPGQLLRASVELAKSWRTDRALRNLDAVLVVADEHVSLQVTGSGDVIEPEDGIIAVGSGGPYAIAALRALQLVPSLSAANAAHRALSIAADCCVYTNHNISVETLPNKRADQSEQPQTAVAAATA